MELDKYLEDGNEITLWIESQIDIGSFDSFKQSIDEYFEKSWCSTLKFYVENHNGETVWFELVSENGYDGEVYLEFENDRICQVYDSEEAIKAINEVFMKSV